MHQRLNIKIILKSKIFTLLQAVKAGVVILILYLIGQMFYYNETASETIGYYFAYPSLHYKKGDLVLICITEHKYLHAMHKLGLLYDNSHKCPENSTFLLKQIVAVYKDRVTITSSGVYVNDILYPNSAALSSYHGVPLMPQMHTSFILNANEYFTLGKTPHSYDSRYYGIVKLSQIHKKAWLITK